MMDNPVEITRETFGNIPSSSVVAFYIMAVVSMLVFVWGVWRRWKLWQQGRPISFRQILTGNFQRLKPRLGRLFKEGLGQKRVRGRGLASWAHIMMFAGFMILFLGTTLLEIDHLAAKISERFSFHHGWYYVVYEATLDVFGLLFIVGICLFAWRRMRRPNSIGHRSSDWTALYLFSHRRDRLPRGGFAYRVGRRGWRCGVHGRRMHSQALRRHERANESFRSLGRVVDTCCDEFRVLRDDPVHAAAAFYHRPHEPAFGYANAAS